MTKKNYRPMIENLNDEINRLTGIRGYLEAGLKNPRIVGLKRQEYEIKHSELTKQIEACELRLRHLYRVSWGLEDESSLSDEGVELISAKA